MSFRLKTILGVALIEGSLLLLLVWSGVNYLKELSENELMLRASISAESIANLTRDAVLTTDIARLDSVTQRTLESPGVVYVRIMDSERILSQAGNADVLARPFVQDAHLDEAHDRVFDVGVEIAEGGYTFGRVELGISVARANELIAAAWRHLSGIAVAEMVLVALFSYLLGSYLTRGLLGLAQAARSISNGALGTCIDVNGADELAETGKAFNAMSVRLAETQRDMEHKVRESRALSTRLAEKEQRLATILDTAVDGFVIIDQHGIIDDINSAGAALFGYRAGELVGRNVSSLMPEPERSAHDGYLENYLETGETRIIGHGRRVQGMKKDGSIFPLDLSVSVMTKGDKKMFVGLVRDLSEQMRAEAAVRKSEAMRAAIVDANLDALVTIDAEDRIVEFSGMAEKTFGYSRDAVIGQRMATLLIPPEMRDMHMRGMQKYIATGEGPVIGNRIEVRAMRANGDTFPVELTVQPIDVEGELFFTALIRDISERKAEELALRDSKQRAELASEAKSRFLAHMSHEIRSPLNAVLGSLGLLLDDDLSKDQRLYARTAQTSGKILLSLINDILDFSKIEAGQVILESVGFAVRELVNETMDLVAFKARNKGVFLAAAVDRGVVARVRGDETRLRQILGNLLDNAIKFTDVGAVILTVEQTDTRADAVDLRFTVDDSGIGISPESQTTLFNEFQQVDSSDSTRHGGSGLGLSICRGLAELMGGSIGMQSEPGKGSRFWVEIPLTVIRNDIDTARHTDTPLLNHVVAIGFQPQLAAALQRMCAAAGCEVTYLDGADEAVSVLRAGVQVLLVDSQLVPRDLDVLAQYARSLGVERLLLLTAATTPQAMQRVTSGQYDDLVESPLVMHNLIDALHERPSERGEPPCAGLPAGPATDATQDGRILLAEDSVANQLVATAILRKQGYSVEVANNGREAVERFATGGHDLILMDLRMPEMDGLEATAAIRAMPGGRQIPIIAMTANALQQDVDRCLAAGMDDFVPKPVDKARLFETLVRHIPAVTANDDPPDTNGQTAAGESGGLGDPLIDEGVIRQLGEDVSEEAVPAMLQMFISEAATRAGNVLKALGESSIESVEDEAHTLKSCAGTFGAARLAALARDIEAACREENRQTAVILGERMDGLLQQTLSAYRERFSYLSVATEE